MRPKHVLAWTFPALVIGIVLIERLATRGQARRYECVLLAVLCGVAAWATPGRLRNVLVMGCSLFVGLAAIQTLSLVFRGGDRHEEIVADDSGLAQPRALVGWGPVKPGVYRSTKRSTSGHTIFDTEVTIDPALDRKTVPDGPRPIAFFGDSWVYGDGVKDSETLPQVFADLTGRKIPVLNLSFAGWSPAQNLIALQSGLYKDLLVAPRHFVLFTATFHVERIACKSNYAIGQGPRYVPDGDGIRYAGSCADALWKIVPPLVRIARGFGFYQRFVASSARPNRQDIELYLKVIEAFVATAKHDYNVPTTVFFAPFDDAYIAGSGWTEAQIIGALRKAGVDVLVSHLPPIDNDDLYWIQGDGHPTALAYRAMAHEIEAHLREVDPKALEDAPDSPR